MADITRVVSTGPSAQRVDVVFVAEGYQASERSKFLADVAIFSDYMFSVSSNMSRLNAPFSAFENYFNVSALFVASAQSGTDQPNKGIFVDTYFNSTQHGADGRLNYGDRNKLAMLMSQSFAADAREIGVVLINARCTVERGSSAWVTTDDVASIVKRRGYAEFGVNGQSTASASRPVRKHDDVQEARSTRRIDGQPAGQLQEA